MRYRLQQSNEELNSVGGLVFVGPILAVSRLKQLANTIRISKTADQGPNDDILSAAIELLVQGKTIYRGILADPHDASGDETFAPFQVFEVTVRTIDSRGQHLLIPEIDIDAWWTNLPESAGEIIALYYIHATSEQYHSKLKSDMNLERLPSDKFKTNATILQVGMVAFNVLRLIGQTAEVEASRAGKKVRWVGRARTVQRRRLRTVMQDLITVAVKRVRHAGRTVLKMG